MIFHLKSTNFLVKSARWNAKSARRITHQINKKLEITVHSAYSVIGQLISNAIPKNLWMKKWEQYTFAQSVQTT